MPDIRDAHLGFTGFTSKRIHLGVSGSVAAYRAPDLLRMWLLAGASVGVTLTECATRFISGLTFSALGAYPVQSEMFLANAHLQDSQEVFGHLLPGQAASAFVIAPASATTLARLAHGLADELLSCQALAYDGRLLIAPAMNPRMWDNPANRANADILVQRGHQIVAPGFGTTACREEGQGRLADVRQIFLYGLKALTGQKLAGRTALLTIGPTAEPWDDVRIWTNRSSGLMGASLALALWLHGAKVHAVCGPGVPWLPSEIETSPVQTAREMFDAAQSLFSWADIAAFTAAVADFSPVRFGGGKFKKSTVADEGFAVDFTPNPDIFAALGARKRPGQLLVGFAAESSELLENMRAKMLAKKADLMIGNLIGQPDAAFAAPTNRVEALDAQGRHELWPLMSKPDTAWRIVEWLLRL